MDQGIRIEDVERAFRSWRRGKGAGSPKAIPEELWEQAVALAGVYGPTATAQLLRLNYAKLKHRCEREPSNGGFVELAASELSHAGESVVELESAAGSRLRLVLHGASVATVTAAAKALWSVAR